jgi:hypothetical protein
MDPAACLVRAEQGASNSEIFHSGSCGDMTRAAYTSDLKKYLGESS